jgi:hypothetical protein
MLVNGVNGMNARAKALYSPAFTSFTPFMPFTLFTSFTSRVQTEGKGEVSTVARDQRRQLAATCVKDGTDER